MRRAIWPMLLLVAMAGAIWSATSTGRVIGVAATLWVAVLMAADAQRGDDQ